MTAVICALAMLLGAEAFDQEFKAANSAYEANKFDDAIAGYERLIASGAVSPEVFFNLGNAYLSADRLGPAIANYERAVALRPAFPEAKDNLEKAIGATKNHLPKPLRPAWQQALLFWDTGLTFATSRTLAMVTWIAFWIVLLIGLFRRIPYARPIAVLLCVFAVLSGLSAWCKAHPVPLAVGAVPAPKEAAAPGNTPVTFSAESEFSVTEGAPVRYGMSETDDVRFVLAEGDRVAVEERRDGWARVRSVDGVRGWVRETQVCFVGPPYDAAPPHTAAKEEP